MTWVLGLTGGIGSGKSALADYLATKGAGVVDTDLIARELTGPGGGAMQTVAAAFPTLIAPDGSLDRAQARALVFSRAEARAQLEAILHPLIRAEAERRIAASAAPYVVAVVPLLVESPAWQGRCDRIAVVDCPEPLQVARVMARSGFSEPQVRAILAAQASRESRLAVADEVIDNSADLASLCRQAEALHARCLTLAGEKRSSGV